MVSRRWSVLGSQWLAASRRWPVVGPLAIGRLLLAASYSPPPTDRRLRIIVPERVLFLPHRVGCSIRSISIAMAVCGISAKVVVVPAFCVSMHVIDQRPPEHSQFRANPARSCSSAALRWRRVLIRGHSDGIQREVLAWLCLALATSPQEATMDRPSAVGPDVLDGMPPARLEAMLVQLRVRQRALPDMTTQSRGRHSSFATPCWR